VLGDRCKAMLEKNHRTLLVRLRIITGDRQ
jgi:hypothetical protein